MGLGDDQPRVEPFGNIRKDRESGRTVVQEVREPVGGCLRGRGSRAGRGRDAGHQVEDVQITVEDDLLTISAARGDKKYRKEVLLPASSAREKTQITCNNGVVEIKCMK